MIRNVSAHTFMLTQHNHIHVFSFLAQQQSKKATCKVHDVLTQVSCYICVYKVAAMSRLLNVYERWSASVMQKVMIQFNQYRTEDKF